MSSESRALPFRLIVFLKPTFDNIIDNGRSLGPALFAGIRPCVRGGEITKLRVLRSSGGLKCAEGRLR